MGVAPSKRNYCAILTHDKNVPIYYLFMVALVKEIRMMVTLREWFDEREKGNGSHFSGNQSKQTL